MLLTGSKINDLRWLWTAITQCPKNTCRFCLQKFRLLWHCMLSLL